MCKMELVRSIQGQFAALSTVEGVALGIFVWVRREFHGAGCYMLSTFIFDVFMCTVY